MTAATDRCPGCHGAGTEMSGTLADELTDTDDRSK